MTDIWSLASIAAKFVVYLGVLTSSGTVFANLIFSLTGSRVFITVFAALGLLGAAFIFLLSGTALTGDLSGMTDRQMLGLLWSTQVGTALTYRLLGLTLILVGSALGKRGRWLSAFGGLLAVMSFLTIGHVPDQNQFWLNGILLFHLLAIALWIGILAPLRNMALTCDLVEAANLGKRFGKLASFFVPLLIFAGLVMSLAIVGSLEALFGTDYGRALILKLVLVSLLLGIAAMN